MTEEQFDLEAEEMQELAPLVADALLEGDSPEAVVDRLVSNGVEQGQAEQLVSAIEYQIYQAQHSGKQHQGGGGGEGMGWLIWIGVILGINLMSYLFGWGFFIY